MNEINNRTNFRDGLIFLLLIAILLTIVIVNRPKEAVIANVIDGDTIATNKNEIIRILGIDTPERDEQGYSIAKARMEQLVLDSKVMLQCEREDKYGRKLCWVYINVIQIMIPEGHSKYIQPY